MSTPANANLIDYRAFRTRLEDCILRAYEFHFDMVTDSLDDCPKIVNVMRLRAEIERARHYAAGEIVANAFETPDCDRSPESHTGRAHANIMRPWTKADRDRLNFIAERHNVKTTERAAEYDLFG